MQPANKDALFLGIDGGGTNCRARLWRARRGVIGEGRSGPANLRFGVAQSFAAVLEATRQSYAAAGVPLESMKSTTACVALAGASEPTYLAAARAQPHPFRTMIVTTDAQAACVGAHGDRDGGIIIVGTGTIGWARLDGHEYRVGGWGFPISDEGSGAWLGCEAIRRLLWAYDGRAPWSPLLESIFADFHRDPHAIVRWVTMATPRDFGQLGRAIVARAETGDPVAHELMRRAAAHVDVLAAQLRSIGVRRIALAGGLAGAMRPWLSHGTQACLVAPKGDALDGALQIAMLGAASIAPVEFAGAVEETP